MIFMMTAKELLLVLLVENHSKNLKCGDFKNMKKHDWKILYALQDAEAQIEYLIGKLSTKEQNFTKPTTDECLDKIRVAKDLLPVELERVVFNSISERDEWFENALKTFNGIKAVKNAAIRICIAYGISGAADPAYIARLIQDELRRP